MYAIIYAPSPKWGAITNFPTEESATDFMYRFIICESCRYSYWKELFKLIPIDDETGECVHCDAEYDIVDMNEYSLEDEKEANSKNITTWQQYIDYMNIKTSKRRRKNIKKLFEKRKQNALDTNVE